MSATTVANAVHVKYIVEISVVDLYDVINHETNA